MTYQIKALAKLVNVVTLKIRISGFRIRKIPENRFRAQWFIFEFGAVEVKVVHNDSVVLFQCTLSHVLLYLKNMIQSSINIHFNQFFV